LLRRSREAATFGFELVVGAAGAALELARRSEMAKAPGSGQGPMHGRSAVLVVM